MDLERISLQGQQAGHHKQACQLGCAAVMQTETHQEGCKLLGPHKRCCSHSCKYQQEDIAHHYYGCDPQVFSMVNLCWLNENGLSAPYIARHSYRCGPQVLSIVHHALLAK